jgi:hypothetical protein
MSMTKFYFGKVTEVYPPNHPKNRSKYQYEYAILITGDDYSQLPCQAIRNDSSGMIDDYEDEVLSVDANVFVLFPRGDISMGVIMGGGRNFKTAQDVRKGKYFLKRFNRIEMGIDKDFNFMVKSDSGPFAQVHTNKVELNDSVGESIKLDKDKRVLYINANNIDIVIRTDKDSFANITVEGNLNAKVSKNATIQADVMTATVNKTLTANAKDVSVTASSSAKVKCKELTAEASGKAKIKATSISLNGEASPITTEQSHLGVVDLITGVPVNGVKTVKSG